MSHLATGGFYLSAVKRYVGTIGPISEISGSNILVLGQLQCASNILHAVDYERTQPSTRRKLVINIIQTPCSPRAYVIATAGPPGVEKT